MQIPSADQIDESPRLDKALLLLRLYALLVTRIQKSASAPYILVASIRSARNVYTDVSVPSSITARAQAES